MKEAGLTEREINSALTLSEMAAELGISPQGMIYTVKTPMFKAHVRAVDTRRGRRTWHRADFQRYAKLRERLAKTTAGQ
jgi:predicted transcriptional regulator